MEDPTIYYKNEIELLKKELKESADNIRIHLLSECKNHGETFKALDKAKEENQKLKAELEKCKLQRNTEVTGRRDSYGLVLMYNKELEEIFKLYRKKMLDILTDSPSLESNLNIILEDEFKRFEKYDINKTIKECVKWSNPTLRGATSEQYFKAGARIMYRYMTQKKKT